MLAANASTYIYYQRRVPWFNNSTFFFQIGRYQYYYYWIWYSFLNYKEPQEKLRDDLSHVSARRRQFMDMVVSRRQTRQVFIKWISCLMFCMRIFVRLCPHWNFVFQIPVLISTTIKMFQDQIHCLLRFSRDSIFSK